MLDFYIIQREDSELFYAGFGCLDGRKKSFKQGDLSSIWVSELWHAAIVIKEHLNDILSSIKAIEEHREIDFNLRAIHISEIENSDDLITDMDTFRVHHKEPTLLQELQILEEDSE